MVLPVKFEVLIAGEGPERETLTQDIVAHDCSEIKLIGYVANPKQFLAGLHLYLQPSNREGFCIAVHEAMQAGLPVIASDTGQIPYSVSKNSGWIIPAGDPNTLADALIDALSKPEQLHAMGRHAREFIQPLYSEKMFEESGIRILDKLQELLTPEIN
jgi:glycosyltransferase involved in cell wall biosynthesis